MIAFAPDAEITLEANPATVERGRFAEYRDAGVNRVSLGAQSFDPATAQGARPHPRARRRDPRAAEELHAAGLANFNLDLMFALPGQTRAGALRGSDRRARARARAPVALPADARARHAVRRAAARSCPDDESCWDMQVDCHALLAARGFAQYEVSAFARAGRAVPPQPELLALRGLPRRSAPARTAS